MRLISLIGIVLALVWILGGATPARAFSLKGFFSGSLYNRDDDAASQDFSITRFRLKLKASDFAGENTSFHFRGSTRSAGGVDFHSDIPDTRINTARIDIERVFRITDVSVGRMYIREIPTARVDGGDLRVRLWRDFGIGLFGGQAPDPVTDEFSGDYTIYGGYVFYKTPFIGVSAGAAQRAFKGTEDNSFFYGTAYLAPMKELRVFGSLRSDHNVDTGKYDHTNALISVNWRPSRRARLNFAYNEYRARLIFQSLDYSLDYELQKTFRIGGDFRITDSTRVYARADGRTRESDNKSASLYLVGLKQKDIFQWFYVDLVYRSVNYFTSNVTQAKVAAGADVDGSLNVELSATYMTNEQDDASNSLEQWIYSASVDWFVTRQMYVSARVEQSTESYLDVESVLVEKVSDTFDALTFFLYAGYRF